MRSSDGFFYEGEVFYPFQDMLFNALLSFTFMFLVAFMLINPVAQDAKVDPKAEFLITINWPDNHPDDMDLYVQDPQGGMVWYKGREAGLMHLDRDDRGNFRDTINVDGQRIQNPLNQETVSMRGFMKGEYTVNIHQYLAQNATERVPVSVKNEKLNPVVTLVYYATVEMHDQMEQTVARFILDDNGGVVDMRFDPKSLARR